MRVVKRIKVELASPFSQRLQKKETSHGSMLKLDINNMNNFYENFKEILERIIFLKRYFSIMDVPSFSARVRPQENRNGGNEKETEFRRGHSFGGIDQKRIFGTCDGKHSH